MTKVILDIPNPLHRMIKSIAVSKGESMKNIILQGLESLVKKEIKSEIKTPNDEYITEEEADAMLRPYLLKLIEKIDKKEEKLLTWEEVKKNSKNKMLKIRFTTRFSKELKNLKKKYKKIEKDLEPTISDLTQGKISGN